MSDTLIYILGIISGFCLLIAFQHIDRRYTDASHADCVQYWQARTSAWRNPPSLERIHADSVYCGTVV